MKYLTLIACCCLLMSCSTQAPPNADRGTLFRHFLKKFDPIELPFVARDLGESDWDNADPINAAAGDTLFTHQEELRCMGYLKDTSKFFTLIYIVPADGYFPFAITYTKGAKIISEESLIVNGIGGDCGLSGGSSSAFIGKDLSIYCVDTLNWEFFCDEMGEPIPNTAERWVNTMRGKISSSGKIMMGPIRETKTKLPASAPPVSPPADSLASAEQK